MTSSKNKKNLKIVMLTASLPPMPAGGAEMQAIRLAKQLQLHGHEVFFLTPGSSQAHGKGLIENIPAYRLNSFLNRMFLWLSKKKKASLNPLVRIDFDDKKDITHAITTKVGWPTIAYYTIFYWHALFLLWPKRKSIDIIHAHTMEWSAIVATKLGKRLKKPVVIKDSTMNGLESLQRYPSGKEKQQEIIRHAYFVAMTKAIEINLSILVPADKIIRIPNGIDIRSFVVDSSTEKKGKNVLFVGNLYQQPAKGIDILLRCWALVSKKHPTAILSIVGDGRISAYVEHVKKLGIEETVRFEGKQINMQPFYRSASFFVLPSRREGMSNALMEAMLYGLPCVVTDISGSQDLVIEKHNGLIVPPAQVQPLADAICYLIEHPIEAKEMGVNSQNRIKKFSIESIAESYLSFYKRIMNDTVQ